MTNVVGIDLSKGRLEVPARRHPDLRPFYPGLCQQGQARKTALVTVMRKLLLPLNAVARRGVPWVAG